jgi:nucleoside-diphosphate-sugar epimerase
MLVTGVAGFIGSHLWRLVADGHEVVGLDDLSEGKLENLAGVPEVRVVETDLRDEDAVRVAADGCAVVYHQGAMRSVPRSIAQPEKPPPINVRGTLNVLLSAARRGQASASHPPLRYIWDRESFPLREDMEPPAPIALRCKQVGG